MKEVTPLFTAEQLEKMPLTYHHMTVLHTVEVKEIGKQKKYSKSSKHQTVFYLNQVNYKPVCSLIIDE